MGKNKTIGILLSVLLIMIGFWFLRDYLKPKDDTIDNYLKQTAGLSTDQVSQVVVEKAENKLALKKESLGWQVETYKANQESVNQLIKNLLTPDSPELVAETNAQHKNLGVDNDNGTKITFSNGEKQVVWVVGNPAADGFYVKFNDGDAVYLVKGIPTTAVDAAIGSWLDKTLAQIQESALKTMSITDKNGKTIKLVRTGGDWFEEGKQTALDPEPLTPLLTKLAALTTQGLVEDEKSIGKTPVLVLKLDLDGGGTQTLTAYTNGESGYALENSDRPGKFLIDKTIFDALNLDVKALKPKPTPSPSPGV